LFTTKFQEWVRRQALRLADRLRRVPFLSPNGLTLAGLVITTLGAVVLAYGHLLIAGLILVFAGLFDILDGALARASGRQYRYGAFLDSTTDRYSEGVVYLGILVYFLARHATAEPILVYSTLAGSFLVSYVRARAQSLGFTCDVGFMARPERVVIITAGLILGQLTPALWILALGTNLTALQRVAVVWRQSREERRADRNARKAELRAYQASRPKARILFPWRDHN
jgi:CDP-diacylglycerol--glycerol-3-phosphate 3-phosphatidyltransferase